MPACDNRPMGTPEGFSYALRKNGDVVISHHGRIAATLRGRAAERFMTEVEGTDGQALMARRTGNYKRGNERQGR